MNRGLDLVYAAEVLRQLDNVLIVTHEKPDGDAFGSALGLGRIMMENGRRAQVLLPEPLPEKYRALAGGDFRTALLPGELEAFDAVITLDAACDSRVALGEGRQFPLPEISVLNLDHHPDNSVSAEWSCVDGSMAATAELVARLTGLIGWEISPWAATMLLLGIVTDTGSFRFTNTTAETLRTAARLNECGADWERVVNAAFFAKPRRQQEFEAAMLQSCVRSAWDGRFLYALIPDELFARYDFDMRDGETVIDLLREVAGVVVCALGYRRNGVFKLSLRSKDSRWPVGPVAQAFGGGGHRMAAGATVVASDFAELEKMLLKQVGELFESTL